MGSPGCLHTDHTDPTTDYVVKKSAQDTRSDRPHDFAASVKVVDAKSGKQYRINNLERESFRLPCANQHAVSATNQGQRFNPPPGHNI